MMQALKWVGIIAAALVVSRLLAWLLALLFTLTLTVFIAIACIITGVRYEVN